MSGMLLGMALAFGASIFWTISPVCFAAAGRKIGAYNVNVLRLAMAGLMLGAIGIVYALCAGGFDLFAVPFKGFLYLVLSGLFGLVVGDMFYLRSLTLLGPRRTTQFITLAPILPVIFAWIILGEALSWNLLLGIALIVGGIAYIVFHDYGPVPAASAEPGTFSVQGLIIALISVLFHSMGAVMARWAFIEAPD
ncbi:MAG: DMT family transporter, partial [Chitinispirillaceae bacterium]|nr:DMT family transporter [Chitinispirillaceae bacterium]